jgi:hypothetical protein
MYDNIGGKIKGFAAVVFFFDAIAAVVSGIVLISNDAVAVGFLAILCGPIAAWVMSWLLYGFGQLIENTDIIAGRHEASSEKQEKVITQNSNQTTAQHSTEDYAFVDITCPKCKASLSFPNWQLQCGDGVTCPMCDTHISL